MNLHKGDHVVWNTPQGLTHGVTEERHVETFKHDGQKFNASADEPFWIVRSDNSGKTAAHKESSLGRR